MFTCTVHDDLWTAISYNKSMWFYNKLMAQGICKQNLILSEITKNLEKKLGIW